MANSDGDGRECKQENVWLVKFDGSTTTAFKLLFTFGVDSRQIIIFLISAALALSLPISCCVHDVSDAIQTVNSIGASQFLYCLFSLRRTKRMKYAGDIYLDTFCFRNLSLMKCVLLFEENMIFNSERFSSRRYFSILFLFWGQVNNGIKEKSILFRNFAVNTKFRCESENKRMLSF